MNIAFAPLVPMLRAAQVAASNAANAALRCRGSQVTRAFTLLRQTHQTNLGIYLTVLTTTTDPYLLSLAHDPLHRFWAAMKTRSEREGNSGGSKSLPLAHTLLSVCPGTRVED